jgi:hypothetical protein
LHHQQAFALPSIEIERLHGGSLSKTIEGPAARPALLALLHKVTAAFQVARSMLQ